QHRLLNEAAPRLHVLLATEPALRALGAPNGDHARVHVEHRTDALARNRAHVREFQLTEVVANHLDILDLAEELDGAAAAPVGVFLLPLLLGDLELAVLRRALG